MTHTETIYYRVDDGPDATGDYRAVAEIMDEGLVHVVVYASSIDAAFAKLRRVIRRFMPDTTTVWERIYTEIPYGPHIREE